jgi:hypothetical protein
MQSRLNIKKKLAIAVITVVKIEMVVICISNAIKLKNIFPKMLTLVITQ